MCPHRGDTAPAALSLQIAPGGGGPAAGFMVGPPSLAQAAPCQLQPGASIPQPASLLPDEKPQFSCLRAEYLTPSPAQRELSACHSRLLLGNRWAQRAASRREGSLSHILHTPRTKHACLGGAVGNTARGRWLPAGIVARGLPSFWPGWLSRISKPCPGQQGWRGLDGKGFRTSPVAGLLSLSC